MLSWLILSTAIIYNIKSFAILNGPRAFFAIHEDVFKLSEASVLEVALLCGMYSDSVSVGVINISASNSYIGSRPELVNQSSDSRSSTVARLC